MGALRNPHPSRHPLQDPDQFTTVDLGLSNFCGSCAARATVSQISEVSEVLLLLKLSMAFLDFRLTASLSTMVVAHVYEQ